MKRILFLTIIFSLFAFATDSTRTTLYKLPQFSAGSKLLAGTKSDSAQSNFSLNNGFYRLEAILSRQIDANGWFNTVYGDGTGDLLINARGGHIYRIQFDDSILCSYNANIQGSLLVQGNAYVGGYLTVDSIQTNNNLWFGGSVGIGGTLTTYGALTSYGNIFSLGGYMQADSIEIRPIDEGFAGVVRIRDDNVVSAKYARLTTLTLSADRTHSFPDRSGTVALQTNNDSIQATTVHAVLFNSAVVSGTTLNDSAGNYQEWTTNATGGRTIVRMRYLHKAGIKNIVARVQMKTDANDYYGLLNVGSLSGNSTASDASYTANTITVGVTGLTAGALYDLKFTLKVVISGTASATQLVITAESN